ncbi:MAG TPA: sulfocyanin-like copper-binding protein [Gemmatimonadales bacterium]|nr:sulfocyanin-like copper-binding protein [Gemmatimonadales bacterium]
MRTPIGSFVLAAALLGAAAPRAASAQGATMKVDPSWVITRTSDSTVEFRLVAGMSPANGGMNFDGATAGSLTLTVPIKWHVVLHFRNDDENMPHSAEVTVAKAPVPAMPDTKPAFGGAESKDATQGVNAGTKQDVHFTADQPGSYIIVCAVPGHGAAGMWIRLVVSATATRPDIVTGPATP